MGCSMVAVPADIVLFYPETRHAEFGGVIRNRLMEPRFKNRDERGRREQPPEKHG